MKKTILIPIIYPFTKFIEDFSKVTKKNYNLIGYCDFNADKDFWEQKNYFNKIYSFEDIGEDFLNERQISEFLKKYSIDEDKIYKGYNEYINFENAKEFKKKFDDNLKKKVKQRNISFANKLFSKNKIDIIFTEHIDGEFSYILEKIAIKKKIYIYLLFQLYFDNKFLFLDPKTLKAKSFIKLSYNKEKKIFDFLIKKISKETFAPLEIGTIKYAKQFSPNRKRVTDYDIKNTFFEKIINRFCNYYKKIYFSFISVNYDLKNTNRSFVTYFCHREPEMSGYSKFNSNQLTQIDAIKILRILLPKKIDLLVKEHNSQFTTSKLKEIAFYKYCKNTNGVYLLKKDVDKNMLIKYSKFISTICGTVAFESFLFNKNTFLFGENFFSFLHNIKKYTGKNLNDKKSVIKLLNQRKPYLNYTMHLKDFTKIISLYYDGNFDGNTNVKKNSKIIAKSLFIFLQKLFKYKKN
jgi:hypothetical protein